MSPIIGDTDLLICDCPSLLQVEVKIIKLLESLNFNKNKIINKDFVFGKF